ncbi:MAG: DUF6111 family protein [Pseudomonadota bacterium]
MIRVILQNILLFILPTLIYFAITMIRQRVRSFQDAGQILERAPLAWLLGAGCVFMIGGLLYFNSQTSHTTGRPGETYQPPVYRDGKVIPGHRQ